jgi:hypothetical protein
MFTSSFSSSFILFEWIRHAAYAVDTFVDALNTSTLIIIITLSVRIDRSFIDIQLIDNIAVKVDNNEVAIVFDEFDWDRMIDLKEHNIMNRKVNRNKPR